MTLSDHDAATKLLNINIQRIWPVSRTQASAPTSKHLQFMRADWRSNGIVDRDEAIVEAACDPWNRLIDQPGTIHQSALAIGLVSIKDDGHW